MEAFSVSYHTLSSEPRFDVRYYDPKYDVLSVFMENHAYPVKAIEEVIISILEGRITPKQDCYVEEDGVPFIRAQNIKEDYIDLTKVKLISRDAFNEDRKSQVSPGEVILTIDGVLLGIACHVSENMPSACISNHLVRIIPNEEISAEYLPIFINSHWGQLQVERGITGAAIPGLRTDAIKRFQIPVPPREVQFQIAQIMQTAYAERREG